MKKIKKTVSVMAAMLGIAMALQTAPAHAESIYKAKEGDTFYSLSKKFHVNLNTLMKANPKIKPTNIYAGLKIVIPTSSKPATIKAASTGSAKIISANSHVVQAWGKTFNYSKIINVTATAYSSDNSENGWGPVDYFGNPLKLGTIAVDPKVIPLGTKVLVTGYSHPNLPKTAFVAVASDTGSAIKGNRIDIFIPGSKATVNEFGFQDVKLYVIK
ncbi:3D domain-containing protein [Paenibacillus sediminis]|uniref:3D (Asp-Asp-Asp) domain-containing protein n=1 Tax=Paenibacillus sediminis TaxID=664909 RepID=A0ABS4H098_9BACL|nr:3D domain-containing protein [Paenibacillus sediminis]MBP1935957.1 3D (Asp-Asp-Asp) domain-containing protein [Paenibacillus sediminis]